MTFKDLLITPIWLMIIYALAYLIRPYVTDRINRRYFIPGLTLKIVGAISLGLIYQFYYGGGDTFTYFNLGSKHIWNAFLDDPTKAFTLIFGDMAYQGPVWEYASKIFSYGDESSFFVVRVAGFFDIFTAHTYSATAILFATVSFSGLWAMYSSLYKMHQSIHFRLAIAVFFIPSLFFWGSGLLKDPLSLGALGWLTYAIHKLFIDRGNKLVNGFIAVFAAFIIYKVKIYILLSFLPAALIWITARPLSQVKNVFIKTALAPILLVLAIYVGYFTIQTVGETHHRYNLETIAYTAESTAKWIHYVSVKQGGAAYTLGDFDYSPAGMMRKFPQAVWVTLFRPYPWESNNVVMLLSAMESFAMFFLTIYILFTTGFINFFKIISANPFLAFCFVFAIFFSFAVGITTYNFGSLVRYKIPMYPFFVSGLFIVQYYAQREKVMKRLRVQE